MQGTFSLITRKWLAVRRERQALDWISPKEITSVTEHGAVVDFAWGRPDFDLASHEFMIGLLTIALPSNARDGDWENFYRQPPTPDQLEKALAPYADDFLLDGDGARFLQDFNKIDGYPNPIETLLIDAPGSNTIKHNKDLFIKRASVTRLSRASAAIAIYTLQQFAPSGGAGHRTSLRGGGPLVTLATEGERETNLWRRLWLNVPTLTAENYANYDVLPWLAATKTSKNKEVVHEDEDSNSAQAFFGMPRRLRLVFASNDAGAPCDLTGVIDDVIVIGVVTEPWGVNYGVWKHPLTPYKEDQLPVHAPEARLGYRHWLGLVYNASDNTRIPAKCIITARRRLQDFGCGRADIKAGGYAMDNMKALAFAEGVMPMHLVINGDPALREEIGNALSDLATQFVEAARIAESILAASLRFALQGERGNAAKDSSLLDAPRERLWDMTERAFHDLLDKTMTKLPGDIDDEKGVRHDLRHAWRNCIFAASFTIFDETAPIEMSSSLNVRDIVLGRKLLTSSFGGYGKHGASFFKALGLPPPQLTTKSRKNKDVST